MDNEWRLVTRHAKKTRKPKQPQQQQQQPQQQQPQQKQQPQKQQKQPQKQKQQPSAEVKNVTANDNKNFGHAVKKSLSKQKVLNDKFDHESEQVMLKNIPFGVGNLIQQARKAQGYSQKEFAIKINERPQVVQDFEAGSGMINKSVIEKMEKVLSIKLFGTENGKLLKFK